MDKNSDVAQAIASALDEAMRTFYKGKRISRISQADLSRRSGVPQPTISRTLQGKSIPETETISRLVSVLGTGNVKIGEVIASLLPKDATPARLVQQPGVAVFKKEKKTQRERNIDEIVALLHKTSDPGIKAALMRVREFSEEFPLISKQQSSSQ